MKHFTVKQWTTGPNAGSWAIVDASGHVERFHDSKAVATAQAQVLNKLHVIMAKQAKAKRK